ncbi:hypothetical protein WN943_025259 [Citrus x changshan-huyou]
MLMVKLSTRKELLELGVLISNAEGEVMAAYNQRINCLNDVEFVEAVAVIADVRLSGVIDEIIELLDRNYFKRECAPRECNEAAHLMAKLTIKSPNEQVLDGRCS